MTFEQIHFSEMISDMPKSWHQTTPHGGLVGQPGNLCLHCWCQVFWMGLAVRRDVWYVIKHQFIIGCQPLHQRGMDRIRVLYNLLLRHFVGQPIRFFSSHPNPDAGCRQGPSPHPLRAADDFWHASNQRVQRPILGSGNMPKIEARQICPRQGASSLFLLGKVISHGVEDHVNVGKLALQQFWRLHDDGLFLYPFGNPFGANEENRVW